MNCQKFIAVLFASRDFAHKHHLNTTSYAKHKALDKFYTGLIPLVDDFAEMYQGRHEEKISSIPTYDSKSTGNTLAVLKSHLTEIEAMREKVCGDCTALQNQFDEIVALYLKTIYKLKFLE